MCLIVFAYKAHPGYRLILAANRDEYYDRPTVPAHFWRNHPRLMAGKDIRWGGTWLGVTRDGKFAAVTNYRDFSSQLKHGLSRGLMLYDYLSGEKTPGIFLEKLEKSKNLYDGYNLILGDQGTLYYSSNRDGDHRLVGPGIYGLSNHLLDTPWPKVLRARALLGAILAEGPEPSTEKLLDMLKDRQRAPDELLPETGAGLKWERFLSSIFIAGESYGTRSSTVLLIDDKNRVTFTERSFRHADDPGTTVRFQFDIIV